MVSNTRLPLATLADVSKLRWSENRNRYILAPHIAVIRCYDNGRPL